MKTVIDFDFGLFGRLRRDAKAAWAAYVRHPFVAALGDGTLAQPQFRNFLIQDYLFLIQYARAYMLAAYKHDGLSDMREAMRTASMLLDVEMPLHVSYCAGWGISEAQMEAAAPSLELLAYTRFVLERGVAGDVLDLTVALAPCIMGYAEIAEILAADPATKWEGNPYQPWIEAYLGAEYRASVAKAILMLDELGAKRGAPARYDALLRDFTTACRLEARFWETGWHLPNEP
jgi:thiaminase/transcriptional activator TenA